MLEIFRRLFKRPLLAAEILIATFFIALLALAMPMYVIQLLNRYVSYGFHGTLITLTVGMLMAILLQTGFRILRTKMAAAVNETPNNELSVQILEIISRAKAGPMEQLSRPRVQESLNHVQAIQTGYDAQTLNTVMDAPFSLIFIAAIYLLSPVLAGITLTGICIGLFLGWLSLRRSFFRAEQLSEQMVKHRQVNTSGINAHDTVRVFNAIGFLKDIWDRQIAKISRLRRLTTDGKELSQTLSLTGGSLTSVLLYAAGAVIVVQGDLTVGALIGANILCARAYQSLSRLVQVSFQLKKAGEAEKALLPLRRLPLEPASGSAIRKYSGRLELKDVGFAYPQTVHPLFESVNLTLEPGQVLAVCGANGTGKTTLARMLAGLLEPRRGSVLADDVNLAQLAAPWWRSQLMYMPQEPSFIHATIRENILMANPELSDGQLNDLLRAADLKGFLDLTPQGINGVIKDNGRYFPPGIRQRISFARGMATDGRLAILDEPTSGMDEAGMESVYAIMNAFSRAGKTMVVCTNEPKIIKGASLCLNLDVKPRPALTFQDVPAAGQEVGNAGQ